MTASGGARTDGPEPPTGRPVADADRLAAVRESGLPAAVDSAAFDRLARLAARLLAVPVSLVTVVDENRQVFVGQHGLSEPWATARQTPLSHSFCRHVVESGKPLVIDDARLDPRLRDNLAIPELGVVGYCAVPLATRDGRVLGAFCAIEHRPRAWSSSDLGTLLDLAAIAMSEIGHRSELARRTASEDRLRVLVSEIDHRVKNSLAVTRSLLEMQARTADDSYIREQLEEAATRVSTIALVHDRLYGHETAASIRLDDYLPRLCADLAASFGVGPEGFRIAAAPVAMPVDRVVSLGLIVTHLVTTAMKRRSDRVTVSFATDAAGDHVLTVGDAADALAQAEAGRSTGLGSRLMSALTRQFGGEATTTPDGGVHIRIPRAALE
ncbi:sensor histidine kinase [Stella sp.]|uniref:sensor histidine kinase n=1 Tax=Stella sp. TaxID=2912054 RepID=UPI0035B2DD1D